MRKRGTVVAVMIGRGNWQQVLVFTRTKYARTIWRNSLIKTAFRSAAIHGNKIAGRTRALADFKSGDIRAGGDGYCGAWSG